jgi:hypothetical protein
MSNTESTSKALLPDVQAYFDAREGAEKTYQDDLAKINADPRFQIGVLEDRYGDKWQFKLQEARALRRELDEVYYGAPTTAWNEHLATSDNTLVKWIADNCKGYQDYADEILRLLPATRDELDAYAASREWCREWNNLADRAVADGVFPEDTTPPALKEVRRYVLRNFRKDRVTSVMNKVNAAIAEAVEAAKVEWEAAQTAASESVTLADDNPPSNER